MSDDFLTDPGQDADGSALRKYANAQAARAKQFEEELSKLKGELAARSRTDVLNELKVPEGIRKFYTGDATPDAVKAWIEENKTVFNFGDGAATTTDAPSTQDGNGTQIPAEIVAQQQRLQAAADASRDNAGGVGFEGFKAAAAQLMTSGSRPSEADLDKLYAQFVGPGSLAAPQQL